MTRRATSTYVDPSPDSFVGRMRKIIFDLLQEHNTDGTIPTNLRFLFYELVMRGVLSKEKTDSRPPSHIVSTAATDLRERGFIPWHWIVDETRSLENFVGARNIQAWITDVLDQARLDPWDGAVPMVITESRSLAGTLRSLCDQYAVRLASTNGQVGGFLHTELIPVLNEDDRVLYLGDYDLAGNDIEANTRRVLEDEVGPLQWERLALTEQQVRRYHLPTIIKHDHRFKGNRGRHEAVETEALSQKLIVKLLKQRLDRLLPEPLKDVLVRETEQREQVETLLNGGDDQ